MKRGLPILFGLLLFGCNKTPTESALDLSAKLGGQAEQGFSRAFEPRMFQFPQDHAAHPGFRNEWWYITGNLTDESKNRYGYQVTLFRIALSPKPSVSDSNWATNQVWMAHVALTDVNANRHSYEQRLARGAVGLAGQSDQPFRVWLEDWQIIGGEQGAFPWAIDVKAREFALHLRLTPHKPVVLQGDKGLSQKSSEPGNASYYYSSTRLQTRGEITKHGEHVKVNGWSWLDREWSTSALGADQAGWDWFSLQLNDQHELMFYRLRKKNGKMDVHSGGNWILPDGSTHSLSYNDVTVQPLRYWTSPTGRRYPVSWTMDIPDIQRQFKIEALVDDQEMATGIYYWEGAVKVSSAATNDLLGYGYLEMAGY
jgi:predicted secreted hydrolase